MFYNAVVKIPLALSCSKATLFTTHIHSTVEEENSNGTGIQQVTTFKACRNYNWTAKYFENSWLPMF
jgi:hypothetical protein